MKVDYKVPFYSNTPDGTHCFQAGLRMILKYFWPEKDFGWKELEKITAKVEGLWTWPLAGILWMKKNGFEVISVETFDYDAFIKKGGDYLIELSGEDVAYEQIKNSFLPQEIEFAKEVVQEGIVKYAVPTQEMIKDYLKQRYLVAVTVNMRTLNNEEGYVGHFIIVKGFNEDHFIVNDPGLPPRENRLVKFDDFEKAWAYPNEKVKNIMAFSRSSSRKSPLLTHIDFFI